MKRAVVAFRNEKKVGPYLEALRSAGINPVCATPDASIESLEGMGLVLTGGTDVDPAIYGQPLDPRGDEPDIERDRLERRLLSEALATDLPVLAICRGMQLFNVEHSGGTLVQHMEGHKLAQNSMHDVEIYDGTRLAKILGAGVQPVNSRHHQSVAKPGAKLRVSARSPEGVIEGLERPDLRFAIAVQWHPEDMVEKFPLQRRLFEAFGDAL